MESKSTGRFMLGRQSSRAPDRDKEADPAEADGPDGVPDGMDGNIRLMYLTNEGDLDGIRELLESGVDVNFRDIDGRTALHVAACQGRPDVVELLLHKGANVDAEDRWGSTKSCSVQVSDVESLLRKGHRAGGRKFRAITRHRITGGRIRMPVTDLRGAVLA